MSEVIYARARRSTWKFTLAYVRKNLLCLIRLAPGEYLYATASYRVYYLFLENKLCHYMEVDVDHSEVFGGFEQRTQVLSALFKRDRDKREEDARTLG